MWKRGGGAGAAPRLGPGGTQGLCVSPCPPPSLHLHPWPCALSLQPRPVSLPPYLLASLSPWQCLWDPESGRGALVPRKGLCPGLGPHPSGWLTGMRGAAVGRGPMGGGIFFFCLSGSPSPPPVMGGGNGGGEPQGARPGFKSHFHPLLTLGLLRLSLLFWERGLVCSPPRPPSGLWGLQAKR